MIENKRLYYTENGGKTPRGEVSALSNIDRFRKHRVHVHSLSRFLSCETVVRTKVNEAVGVRVVKYVL